MRRANTGKMGGGGELWPYGVWAGPQEEDDVDVTARQPQQQQQQMLKEQEIVWRDRLNNFQFVV